MPPEHVPDRDDEPGDAEHRYRAHSRRAAMRRDWEEAEEEAERCGDKRREGDRR